MATFFSCLFSLSDTRPLRVRNMSPMDSSRPFESSPGETKVVMELWMGFREPCSLIILFIILIISSKGPNRALPILGGFCSTGSSEVQLGNSNQDELVVVVVSPKDFELCRWWW